jgi:hypothetical protein
VFIEGAPRREQAIGEHKTLLAKELLQRESL